ncbi:MAG: sulfatase-like hydrolase/transferase [Verrucomicrobiota bacterium]
MKLVLRTLAAVCLILSAAAAEKPNLLFLFADDMTWKAVDALSEEDIDTPNLDRLVEQGTTFKRAYNPGGWNGAICIAARTMLNTGRPLWHAHAAEKQLNETFVKPGKTWSQLLSQAGYRTCMSGKWHVKMTPAEIFDEVRHIRPGMPRDRKNAYGRPIEGKPDTWSPTDREEGGFWQGGKHWSEVIVDDFHDFLASDDERPWFMYIAFNAPHDPRQSPQADLDRYPLDRIQLPPNFLSEYPFHEPMASGPKLRDEALAPFPRTPFAVKTHRREYYAIVSHLDTQIGRILDRLEESGQADNTVICFTADHGLSVGEHGLLGKQNQYDHSVRVPFILAGPGMPKGKSIDAPIYFQDFMPTTLELAGAPVPDHVAFQSLLPLIQGSGKPREFIVSAYRMTQRMIEKDGRKLILYPAAKIARVYDLHQDPHETKDLIGTPEGRAIAAELFPLLVKGLAETGDTLDLQQSFAYRF